jgi:Prasinovirus endonuclease VII
MKICNACQESLEEDSFYRKRNSLESICKNCKRQKSNHPALVIKRKQRQKKYRQENKIKESLRVLTWQKENRLHVNDRQRKWRREYRRKNPMFSIRCNLSSYLSMLLRGKGGKESKTLDLLGCSLLEFKSWLTSRFQHGMSWEKYGKWHVDHVKPCSKFDLSNPQQQKECFHYTNLQPLWAKENLSKGGR